MSIKRANHFNFNTICSTKQFAYIKRADQCNLPISNGLINAICLNGLIIAIFLLNGPINAICLLNGLIIAICLLNRLINALF